MRRLAGILLVCAAVCSGGHARAGGCPCVVSREGVDPVPGWQFVRVNQPDAVWEVDGSQPLVVRHGWMGLRTGGVADIPDEELCSIVQVYGGFTLWIDGQLISPTFYRITALLDSPCGGVFAYGPVFEIPAGTLGAGIHVFTGEWWQNGVAGTGFTIDNFCPELIDPASGQTPDVWLLPYGYTHRVVVLVTYPSPVPGRGVDPPATIR